uniref:Activin types I and II receptor domain-containing protein n=1 Tax=Panagrolaimus sp. PS1159 TaxID=55785 RepID=A0AC35G0Q8_9BILA
MDYNPNVEECSESVKFCYKLIFLGSNLYFMEKGCNGGMIPDTKSYCNTTGSFLNSMDLGDRTIDCCNTDYCNAGPIDSSLIPSTPKPLNIDLKLVASLKPKSSNSANKNYVLIILLLAVFGIL